MSPEGERPPPPAREPGMEAHSSGYWVQLVVSTVTVVPATTGRARSTWVAQTAAVLILPGLAVAQFFPENTLPSAETACAPWVAASTTQRPDSVFGWVPAATAICRTLAPAS